MKTQYGLMFSAFNPMEAAVVFGGVLIRKGFYRDAEGLWEIISAWPTSRQVIKQTLFGFVILEQYYVGMTLKSKEELRRYRREAIRRN